jgi:hypothetical protein
MSYTVPPTFVDATPGEASDINILGDDLIDHEARIVSQSFSGVTLVDASASVNNATWTDITWDSSTFDEGGWWASGATFTVPAGSVAAGFTSCVVEVTFDCHFVTDNAGVRWQRFLLNGAEYRRFSTGAVDGAGTEMGHTVPIICVDGDEVRVQVYQTSGGALNVDEKFLYAKRAGLIV